MSLRTVEVIILDDSDDDASPRVVTTQVVTRPSAAAAAAAAPNAGRVMRAVMRPRPTSPKLKKIKAIRSLGEIITSPSFKKAKVDESPLGKKHAAATATVSKSHETSNAATVSEPPPTLALAAAATVAPQPPLSLAIAASKPITPSPHPAATGTGTGTATTNIKTLILSPPARATNITQVFPNYKAQPREALELLIARFRTAATTHTGDGEKRDTTNKTDGDSHHSTNTTSTWYHMGMSGSSLCQLPGLIVGGSPVLLPLQTSYYSSYSSVGSSSSSSSSSSSVIGEHTHLAFVKQCLTSLTMSHSHLFAPQAGRIVECPGEKISFLNPYFNALLESSVGAEACMKLLGSNGEELFGQDGSTSNTTTSSAVGEGGKRKYTVSVSMNISGGFFQWGFLQSPLSDDIQRYITSPNTNTTHTSPHHSSSSMNTTTTTTTTKTNTAVMMPTTTTTNTTTTTTTATTATTMPTTAATTTVTSSNYSSQVIVPIGYVMVFVPSLYTGGTIRLSQKSTSSSSSSAALSTTATTATGLTSSQSSASASSCISEAEIDVNVQNENHFQYRYVTWAQDGDAGIKSNIQIGSLISGCRLCLLYKLGAIIQSDLDVNTLINTIPSYFRCKLHPGDIPNLIHTVVQEWNNYAPFNSTSTNIAHPEQTSLILFPNNDDEADVSKKGVIDMLKKVINNGTDLDFREGTMTYIEKGALKPNSNTKLASVSSFSLEVSVDIMTNHKKVYNMPNQDIRNEWKKLLKSVSVAKAERISHSSSENGKRTREPVKCLVLWPRQRTWMVLQMLSGTTGTRTLKSIIHCYDFSFYLNYISHEWIQKNIPAQVERNNYLMKELLEWWACCCYSGYSNHMATRFLDTIVTLKNADLAKLYITTFMCKEFFEKISFDRGSLECISLLFTHAGFSQRFSSLIQKDSIFRVLDACQIRHVVNISVGCYKLFITGKTKPDIPALLDDIICHAMSLIINEKHPSKKAWYESLKQELNSLSHDSEGILHLLEFVSLQVCAKKKSRDYGQLGMDVLVTTVKAISHMSTSDNVGSRIGSYTKMTDHLLKSVLPAGTVQNILVGLVEEVDITQSYKLTYAILTSSEFHYYSYDGNYSLQLAIHLIRRVVLQKNVRYPVDSWSTTKSFLTRLASESLTTASVVDQSIKLSSFMKALQSESLKRNQILDIISITGLMNLMKATAVKYETSGGPFSILFDSDMTNFIIFASLVGSEQASMFMKSLIESSNIGTGGKLIVDLIRCVLDNQSASVQDFSNTSTLLESFLARFIGSASPSHIAEISEMLGDTSASRSPLPKNTLSTIIEFQEKTKGKITMNAGLLSTMETFINVIMLAITHDANNKVKVKIEGSTDRSLAQRIISKCDLESILRALGAARLVPFYESFCSALPIAVAIGFTSELIQCSSKRRSNISDEDRRSKTSILYLASSSVDAIYSVAPESLMNLELTVSLKLISRVASSKGLPSLRKELHTTFESIPAMAPTVLLSSACALLQHRVSVFNQQNVQPYDKGLLIEFLEVICDAWFQNWSTTKNFPALDKFLSKESVQALVSFSGFESVALSICKMADQFNKDAKLIPDLLIYFLCTDDAQKQRALLPTFVTSLLECTNPSLMSKEKWSMLIIILAIFKETNEIDLKRTWEESVNKLLTTGTIPLWQKTALGHVDRLFVAKEVSNEFPVTSTDPKTEASMATHRVVIPNDVKGGDSFFVTVEGTRFKVVCPVGHTPGMSLLIRVPKNQAESSSSISIVTYEVDLFEGPLQKQTINVQIKDKIVQVICPSDMAIGDKMRFLYNGTESGPINAITVKASELKIPSDPNTSTFSFIDEWTYLLNLMTVSLSSETMISILDYSEIFMYSTNDKSVKAASFFAEIAKHVLNVECGIATAPPTASTAATSPMIQSYCVVDVDKLSEDVKVSWVNLMSEVRLFLSSHCLKTASIQVPQYKHKLLSQFVQNNRVPVKCTFSQALNRKWQVSMVKTTSVPFDSGGKNMCSCSGHAWCFGNWREMGQCQAMILNPTLPLETSSKPNKPIPAKKKIDPDQVRAILNHFEAMAKGLEVESEVEVVAPPKRSVALVEVLLE